MSRRVAMAAGALVAAGIAFALHARGVGAHDLAMHRIKAIVALGAAALAYREWQRARQGRRVSESLVRGVAVALVGLSIAAYYQFGSVPLRDAFHRHELFHYYLGAKYERELGYTHLYECATLAQAELGFGEEIAARRVRDLERDELLSGPAVLERSAHCRDDFAPARWRDFVHDVGFFRDVTGRRGMDAIMADHGYNPPPVWTLLGKPLASIAPASRASMLALAAIDPLLYAALFAAIAWAFGWRVAAIAIVFWGCQDPGSLTWMGGTFLRQDWLFLLVLSACAMKRRMFALAGAALAWSALLRVFPALLASGVLVVVARHAWHTRAIHRDHKRMALGAAIATAVLVLASSAVVRRGAWSEFAAHLRVHADIPAANQMGLPILFMHDLDGSQDASVDPTQPDPFVRWRQMRRDRLRALRPIYATAALALGLGVVLCARRVRAPWAALALSLPVAFAAQLACYYFVVFLLAAILSRLRRAVEPMLLGLAGATQVFSTMPAFSSNVNDQYATESLLYLVFSVALIAVFARGGAAAIRSRT